MKRFLYLSIMLMAILPLVAIAQNQFNSVTTEVSSSYNNDLTTVGPLFGKENFPSDNIFWRTQQFKDIRGLSTLPVSQKIVNNTGCRRLFDLDLLSNLPKSEPVLIYFNIDTRDFNEPREIIISEECFLRDYAGKKIYSGVWVPMINNDGSRSRIWVPDNHESKIPTDSLGRYIGDFKMKGHPGHWKEVVNRDGSVSKIWFYD